MYNDCVIADVLKCLSLPASFLWCGRGLVEKEKELQVYCSTSMVRTCSITVMVISVRGPGCQRGL